MKILITSTLLPPIAGGAEQVVLEIAKRLAKHKDVVVHILTTGKYGTKIKENIIIHKVPYIFPLTFFYSTIGKPLINHLLKNYKFDIIYFQIPLPWGFILRNYNANKITSFRGDETWRIIKKNWIIKIIEYILIKKVINKTDIFTTNSKYFSEEIRRMYSIDCEILPNGVDTKKFKPLNAIKQKKNVVLFVGRYLYVKGIKELLKIAEELPQYEFWFCGQGPLDKEIRGENVKNLGFKTQKDLVKIYNKATICAFPSHFEAFGNVALEAMACGKAVIATKSGFSEFLESNKEGILVEPRNKLQLKEAITKLMENQNLRRRLEKNAEEKAKQYEWNKVSQRYYTLYKKIL